MSSENASSDMAQMKVELILDEGKVRIEGKEDFSVDLQSPILKVSELYNAVFADITEPTNITVTASSEVKQSKEARPIFENTKTIIDNAIKEINLGFAELSKEEDDENEEETDGEVGDPLASFRNNPGSLFADSDDATLQAT